MRCKACDTLLSDYEASRKSLITNEYLDLCNHCYSFIQNEVIAFGNPELVSECDENIPTEDETELD